MPNPALDIDGTIKSIEVIRDSFHQDKASYKQALQNIDTDKDARVSSGSKCINVLNSTQLSFTFMSKHLAKKAWWAEIAIEDISDRDKHIYLNSYANFTKVGYIQGIFSAVESSIRIFLRELDPEACNSGTAEFKSIYECLFRSKLKAEPENGVQLLDLLRHIRNTIHNNGVFFHPKAKDVVSVFNGDEYLFEHGKPVGFVPWEFLWEVSESLRLLLNQVISDENVWSIETLIYDPFSEAS